MKRCMGCDELAQNAGGFPGDMCRACAEHGALRDRADLAERRLAIAVKALVRYRDGIAMWGDVAAAAIAEIEACK